MRMRDLSLAGEAPYTLRADREGCGPLVADMLEEAEARQSWDWVRERWPTANLLLRDANNQQIARLNMRFDEPT